MMSEEQKIDPENCEIWISQTAAARRLGCSRQWISKLANAGKIKKQGTQVSWTELENHVLFDKTEEVPKPKVTPEQIEMLNTDRERLIGQVSELNQQIGSLKKALEIERERTEAQRKQVASTEALVASKDESLKIQGNHLGAANEQIATLRETIKGHIATIEVQDDKLVAQEAILVAFESISYWRRIYPGSMNRKSITQKDLDN